MKRKQKKVGVEKLVEGGSTPNRTVYNPITGEYVPEIPGARTVVFVDQKTGAGYDEVLAIFLRAPKHVLILGARMAYGLTEEGYIPQDTTQATDGQLATLPIQESA